MSEDEERSRHSLIPQLQERAKELACLYRIEELLSAPGSSLDEVFRSVVEAIPAGWQYPDICQARIVYGGKIWQTAGFRDGPWMQCANITVQDEVVGRLCVHYTDEMPALHEGPFLEEESKLIGTIAGRLGHFVLHDRLKRTFSKNGDPLNRERGEWRMALDMLGRTDPGLLNRIARRMMNHLCWIGIPEANRLLQRYGEDVKGGSDTGEINEPRRKASPDALADLAETTFSLASNHLDDEEILDRVQKWIDEEKSNFLLRATSEIQSSLSTIWDALRRYRALLPDGIVLSDSADSSVRVALIRRFFADQLDFINIAKHFVEIADFVEIAERIVAPGGSLGRLGGKSSGVFLAERILSRSAREGEDLGPIETPKTWYVASDGLLQFLRYNDLDDVYEQKYKEVEEVRQSYPHLVQVFKNSHFPPEMKQGLSMALDDFGERPLIVRSSSLLEDRLGSAFSGKYKSLFIPNQGGKKQRLERLIDAIAEVYASTFGPDPIGYRAERGLLDFNEEMGILLQEVVGQRVGRYYLPAFAGVALSNNELRWSPRIRREDGLLRMVPGLGTRAVDRLPDDYPILLAPGQPGLRVNVTDDEAVRYSPKMIDAIDLENERFVTLEVEQLLEEAGDDYPAIEKIVSLVDGDRIRKPIGPLDDIEPRRAVVTFAGLVEKTPFVERVDRILRVLRETLGWPVDIEFASDGETFYLLQCRPQCHERNAVSVSIPDDLPSQRVIFSASRYVSSGLVPDLTHVVYVDADRYTELSELDDLRAVGRTVGALNKVLPKRQFALIGPGRWGSRGDIKLGVPVTYSDISNTAVLIEVARKKGNYVPDLSFGTHFFQDLVESSIRYLPLYPDEEDNTFNERWLLGSPNILGSILPEHAHIADVVRVIDVPDNNDGQVLRLLMDADADRAVALLAEPSEPIAVRREPSVEETRRQEDHWSWRLRMAERIAAEIPPEDFGVVNAWVFGSTKNATAGPASDIDLLIHFRGGERQREALLHWLDGWSKCLAEMNYFRTGYRTEGLLDVHLIGNAELERRSSFAAKIGAVTDPARPLNLKRRRRRE